VTNVPLFGSLSDRQDRIEAVRRLTAPGVLTLTVSTVASLDTYEQADALLDVLDKAPVATPGALFRQNQTKEWMESCVIRAVKKLQAAEYHHATSTL